MAVVAAVVAAAGVLLARSFTRERWSVFPSRGTVGRVVDGDSFRLTNYAEVRMLELDAPEMTGAAVALARRSREELTRLIGGRTVRLERGPRATDRYGRFLAYVFVDDGTGKALFVNAEMVRMGLARARTWGPPGERWQEIVEAERAARAARRGMWADDVSDMPAADIPD